MTRLGKIGLSCVGALILALTFLQLLGHLLTGDLRERRAVLEPLLATNAPFQVVSERTGVTFNLWRHDTADWDRVLSLYQSGSKWDRHIAAKMAQASAMGHTSTIDMPTWIFLDENDRLVDFELGTQ
jgi:hypothetical protein